MAIDQAVREERKKQFNSWATYAGFSLAVFVCAVCFIYFIWMLDVWQQPYTEKCQGLCGDVWKVKNVLGSGPIWADFWQPFYFIYEIFVITFLLGYVVFQMESRVALATDDLAHRQRFWWWRGLVVSAKFFCAGYISFFILMFGVGFFLPIYFAAFALLLLGVMLVLVPAVFLGSFIAVCVFNRFWARRGNLTTGMWSGLIGGFVIISGVAVTVFSMLTFPSH